MQTKATNKQTKRKKEGETFPCRRARRAEEAQQKEEEAASIPDEAPPADEAKEEAEYLLCNESK